METDWIAVDWGTSRVRAWALDRGNRVLAWGRSDKGMAGLTPDGFEPALLEIIADWLPEQGPVDIIACGMVGARTGWIEAPYSAVPCRPLVTGRAITAPCADERLRVAILPGLCQSEPADVMRGEETQIAGALGEEESRSGIFCLPGTHSKWVGIENGRVVDFHTFMTGELFDVLTRHSVLRHTLGGEDWDLNWFSEGVSDALADPGSFAGRLFSLRAGALLDGLSAGAGRARLSGLLVGLELAATRAFWESRQTVLIGDGFLMQIYAAALEINGGRTLRIDAEEATLNGLVEARRQLAQGQVGTETG